jgi:hypothetical protein
VFWLFRLVAARRRGGGHRPPMRLCKIGNQQPVELLHVVHTIERCLGRQIIIVLRAQDAVKEPYSAPPRSLIVGAPPVAVFAKGGSCQCWGFMEAPRNRVLAKDAKQARGAFDDHSIQTVRIE